MTAEQKPTTNSNKYQVISVEKTDPPAGMEDGNWFHYVIGQGTSKIEGTRMGTLKGVTKHAEEFAENLNLRGTKGYSAYTSRSQKK
jgi:hypothetical protein